MGIRERISSFNVFIIIQFYYTKNVFSPFQGKGVIPAIPCFLNGATR